MYVIYPCHSTSISIPLLHGHSRCHLLQSKCLPSWNATILYNLDQSWSSMAKADNCQERALASRVRSPTFLAIINSSRIPSHGTVRYTKQVNKRLNLKTASPPLQFCWLIPSTNGQASDLRLEHKGEQPIPFTATSSTTSNAKQHPTGMAPVRSSAWGPSNAGIAAFLGGEVRRSKEEHL